MKFEDFLSLTPKISNLPLPGKQAQLVMAPMDRVKTLTALEIKAMNPRQAAVMALFYKKNEEAYIVLILRKRYKGTHSNQIGFPGGKVEQEDADLQATALRETFEEVGVSPHDITVVKELTNTYIPPSNFWVQSFLGYATKPLHFIAQETEVEAIVEVPLAHLLDPASLGKHRVTTSYVNNLEVPAFRLQEHIVWGATAMMLNEVKTLLVNALKL